MPIFAPEQRKQVESITSTMLETRLRSGECTGVAFITCSEMGWDIAGIPTDVELPVFVFQNVGGCVEDNEDQLRDLFGSKQISDVVVYGHYPCCVLDLALNSAPSAELSESSLLKLAHRTADLRHSIESEYGSMRDRAVMKKASEQFVCRQLIKLMELWPERRSASHPHFHGWLSVDEPSKLLSYDPQLKEFVRQ